MGQPLWSDEAGPIKNVREDMVVLDVAGLEIAAVVHGSVELCVGWDDLAAEQ